MYYRSKNSIMVDAQIASNRKMLFIILNKEVEIELDFMKLARDLNLPLDDNRLNLVPYLKALGLKEEDAIGVYCPKGVEAEETVQPPSGETPYVLSQVTSGASNSFKAQSDLEPKQCLIVCHFVPTDLTDTKLPELGLGSNPSAGGLALANISITSATCGLQGSDAEVIVLADKIVKGQSYRISDFILTIDHTRIEDM